MIITFYSFKGGVGRTLALANVGVFLARNGHRVLAVDFDLEAPGLTRYLENIFGGNLLHKAGLLELLESQRECADAGDLLHRFTVEVLRTNDGGILDLMTSGNQDRSYPRRVLEFDWAGFFSDDDGGEFFEICRREWTRRYDYVLVDSRTGITDSGGICTIQLPDIIVPVFTASRQSVDGVIDIIGRAQEGRQLLAYDRKPAAIVPLPSRFDSRTEYTLAQQWLDEFEAKFAGFYTSWLPKDASVRQVLERTKLPYVPFFSFGERLPVFEETGSDPESLSFALQTITRLLESGLQDVGGVIGADGGARASGNVPGSFSDSPPDAGKQMVSTAEDTFQALDHVTRQAARQLLLRLVRVGLASSDTLVRVDKDELISLSPNPVASATALSAFADAKLINTSDSSASLASTVLLQSWPRLRDWIDHDRTSAFIRQSISEAAAQWLREDRPISALYSGESLNVAEIWAQDAANYSDLGQLERGFLSASQAARGHAEVPIPGRPRPWRLLALLSSLLLVCILSAIILVGRSNSSNPSPSTPVPLASGATTVLAGHTDTVTDVGFNPNGRILATSSADRTVRLWNVIDPTRATPIGAPLTGYTDVVNAVTFASDGHTLATGSADGEVILWDVTDPARPQQLGQPLTGHTGSINAVAFAPDAHTLATGSADGEVILWDVTDPARPQQLGQPLTGQAGSINAVAFSPDGHTLATGGADKSAILWDVRNPGRPQQLGQPLTGHTGSINTVAFSPDAHTLATGSADSTVQLWNLADSTTVALAGAPLTGHKAAVNSIAFSPDGRLLASGSADTTVQLWSVADPTHAKPFGQPLTGPTASVTSVAISPDGQFLAGGSADNTVVIWRLP